MSAPSPPRSPTGAGALFWPAVLLGIGVAACSAYANLSYIVTDPAGYRFFPPFEAGLNANANDHLGAEYYHIACSLARGDGYANPFHRRTGPTAWMPPVFPTLLAALHWAYDGDQRSVMIVVVLLHDLTLIGTGILVLALGRLGNSRPTPWVGVFVFIGALLCDFHHAFQLTHDCWLILLALDVLVAWLCWGRPLRSWQTASGWGVFGGLCALISPVAGFTWAILSIAAARHRQAWRPLGAAGVAAVLVLTPWAVRNYAVFGRLIPVKSNLAYELYQSQCLTPDGVLHLATFGSHPYQASDGYEGREYQEYGEVEFMSLKWRLFLHSVAAAPRGFAARVFNRASAATLLYDPFNQEDEGLCTTGLWLSRVTHPLPFLAVVFLLLTAWRTPLHRVQWVVIGVYLVYLTPYIVVSYYERYAFPLLGVKVVLVVSAAIRLRALALELVGIKRAISTVRWWLSTLPLSSLTDIIESLHNTTLDS